MWRRLLAIGISAAALMPIANAGAQQSQQAQASGGYYDLKNYSYFEPQQPLELRLPVDPVPVDPVPTDPTPTPTPPQTPPPTPSPTPSAPSPTPAPPPAGPSGGGPVPTVSYTPSGPMTFPQGDVAAARADANAFGKTKRGENGGLTTSTDLAATVPGYTGDKLPQESLADDPDGLTGQGTTAAVSSDTWQTVTNPARTKVIVDPDELVRSKAIAANPDAYLQGQSLGGTTGSCTPLPSSAPTEYYEATCNVGSTVTETPRTCTNRMEPVTTSVSAYKYFTVPDNAYGTPLARYRAIAPHIASGICKPAGRAMKACAAHTVYGWPTNKFCNTYNATEYVCTADLNIAAQVSPLTHKSWHERTTTSAVTVTRVDGCGGLANDATCTPDPSGEVCIEPAGTRIIDGVAVTQDCWAWKRDFTCPAITQASDCTDLAANPRCTFLRDECLDDPHVGACQVTNKVYRCPVPTAPNNSVTQYICGEDVYCIDGNCEPIEREASTEFKDALVGLHALGQADDEFDEATLTLFSGEKTGCHKPLFGLVNCCAGKSSGLIPAAAGLAALASGPAAIAALATPFLTLFLCATEEKTLDVKDRMGLCHNLGSYCSDSILGICTSKRTAYCCFESKLTRILQEQGRPQINKPWNPPKTETCKGFSVEEFSRLDLSVMDFSEVYAEFIDAAKLPGELEATDQIQQRIEDYLSQHG